jgi:hypothetical protein
MTIPGNKDKKGGQVVSQNHDGHSSAHTNNIERSEPGAETKRVIIFLQVSFLLRLDL